MSAGAPVPAHPWQVLLAPLPPDAMPTRKPVAPPEITSTPEGASIAGWVNLGVELHTPLAGMRVVSVLLDAAGVPIGANDTVLYRTVLSDAGEGGPLMVEYHTETLGGRLEADGTFVGTRWTTVAVDDERRDDDAEPAMQMTKAEPSEAEVAGLRALVSEVLRRAAGHSPTG